MNFSMIRIALVGCAAMLIALPAHAGALVTFNLTNATLEPIDEGLSLNLTGSAGLIATLTSNENGAPAGVLNSVAGGDDFGVNAAGASDATSLLDNGSGTTESITVSFNKKVKLFSFTVADLAGLDAGTLSFPSGTPFAFSTNGTFTPTGSPLLTVGQSFRLAYSGGAATGFDFDAFSVAIVPEPTTLMLLGPGLALVAFRRRRRA